MSNHNLVLLYIYCVERSVDKNSFSEQRARFLHFMLQEVKIHWGSVRHDTLGISTSRYIGDQYVS